MAIVGNSSDPSINMMIPEFYENCEIFVTGGSGVVGKALIEKLLYSCNVRKIYILLRTRKNVPVDERMKKLRQAKIFDRLHASKPGELKEKLVAIPGDVAKPNLGIAPSDEQMMSNVSIIFHCAATVRFDEPLKVALRLNVAGTLAALQFAETLKQLKVFMHVSTFYSNPYLEYIEPKLYSSAMDWRTCLNILEQFEDEEMLDILTKKLTVGFPNTYTFTKNLAESLVNDYRERMPVAIYRPSIVLFALREPRPGFPPSMMGAMGLFALVGIGVLKTVYIGDNINLDITPMDIGIKSMIYYAVNANHIYQKGIPASVPVYLASSCTHMEKTFKELAIIPEQYGFWEKAAFEKCFMVPSCTYTQSRFLYMYLVIVKQILPALFGDLMLRMFGRKPALMSIVRKGFVTLEVMQPFMFNNFFSPGTTHVDYIVKNFENTDFSIARDLEKGKSDKDLVELVGNMIFNVREILLKEDPKTLARSRKVLKAKYIVLYTIRTICYYYVLRWIYRAYLSPLIMHWL